MADVAAPVGRLTVPVMLVMFHVPDWAAATLSVLLDNVHDLAVVHVPD